MAPRMDFATLGCLSLALAACDAPPPPGELVGQYKIVGSLASDTCGPGLGATQALSFDVQLRDDEGVGYWVFADREPAPGTLDATGKFSFEQRGGWTLVNPNPQLGYNGCRVAQIETIYGTVDLPQGDAGVSDGGVSQALGGLIGSNTIDVIPIPGDDCTPALAAQGGPLTTLPCRVTYTITGTRLND